MKVKRLSITNVLGIEHLEIEPGSVTEIAGANGTGKTSIIEALKAGLGGGAHDATLLRQGAGEGQIVLILEDGVEITKTIRPDSSPLSVRHPTFGKITKTGAYIKTLVDALSLNPVQFLTASKKDRVNQLLQAIPMKVTADQLGFVPVEALSRIDLDQHALEVIGTVGRTIYDLRTGVNRAEKEKRATVSQMSETLPADAPEGGNWSETLTALQDEFRDLQQVAVAEMTNLNRGLTEFKNEAFEEYDAYREKIRTDLEKKVQEFRTAAEKEIAESERGRDEAIRQAEEQFQRERKAAEARYRPKEAELKERIGQAKAMLEQSAKAEKTREFIGQLRCEADRLEAESTRLTHAMGQLEILKSGLLENLPIKGISVQDGDLYVDGLPFDRINESRRIRLAIDIAQLRAGTLGLVAVDGLERLDPNAFDLFKQEAAKSNLQFVISRVAEGPLTINREVA